MNAQWDRIGTCELPFEQMYSKGVKATHSSSQWCSQPCHWWCNYCSAVNCEVVRIAVIMKLSSLLTKEKTSQTLLVMWQHSKISKALQINLHPRKEERNAFQKCVYDTKPFWNLWRVFNSKGNNAAATSSAYLIMPLSRICWEFIFFS